jgi:hypothetical protein
LKTGKTRAIARRFFLGPAGIGNGRCIALAAGLGAALLAPAPALADTRIERLLALAPGGHLLVKSKVGRVAVRGDGASGASVVLTSTRDDFEKAYWLRCEEVPSGVQIVVERRRTGWNRLGWNWFGDWEFVTGRVEIAVSVPGATAASVSVSGGRIEVSGLIGDIDLHSSGGAVTGHDLAGRLDVQSSGGRIDLERVAGDIAADSGGGGVTIRETGGRVGASSSGGRVTVSFAPGNAHGGDILSSGGGVEIHLDPTVGLNVDASGGSVSCDLPVTVQGKLSHDSLKGVLRGGGERLRIRSSGGGIHIGGI